MMIACEYICFHAFIIVQKIYCRCWSKTIILQVSKLLGWWVQQPKNQMCHYINGAKMIACDYTYSCICYRLVNSIAPVVGIKQSHCLVYGIIQTRGMCKSPSLQTSVKKFTSIAMGSTQEHVDLITSCVSP